MDEAPNPRERAKARSEEHTSELQSLRHLVCRLLLEKKKRKANDSHAYCYHYLSVPSYAPRYGRSHFRAVHFLRRVPSCTIARYLSRAVRCRGDCTR